MRPAQLDTSVHGVPGPIRRRSGSGARPGPSAPARCTASGDTAVTALDGVTLDLPAGQFTAIMGPSGSGKSTLMHCLAGLDTLTSGRCSSVTPTSRRSPTASGPILRRDRLGFVFQSFNLLPTLTAEENITLPADLAGRDAGPRVARRPWWPSWTSATGSRHRPSELSGGQQQRVAVARALDLPTRRRLRRRADRRPRLARPAPSCSSSCASVVDDLGQTVVMVTHDPGAAAYADRVVFLVDGRIVEELADPTRERVLEVMGRLGG